MKVKLVLLALSKIILDDRAQMRERLSEEHILALMDLRTRGKAFKDVPVVFFDGENHWCADGFHRITAESRLGRKRIEVEIRQGTLRNAIWYAIGANQEHGLSRKPEDKRRGGLGPLHDEVWGAWSQREIAKQAGVSEGLVRIIKAELKLSAYNTQIGGVKTMRGGTTYTMQPRKAFADMTAPEQVTAINEAENNCPTCGQEWPKEED